VRERGRRRRERERKERERGERTGELKAATVDIFSVATSGEMQ
jgi:hypothetical protein